MDIQSTRFLFILFTLVTLGQMGIDLYVPSFPAISHAFQVPASWVQFTVTLYLIGFGIAQFFFGPISDYIGRRKIVLFGFILFFSSSFFCFIAKNIYWLLVFRFFQGLGASVSGMTRIIVRDLYKNHEIYRISSLMSVFWSLTPIIAPVLGGYIEVMLGWRWNFLFLMTYSAILFYFIFCFLPNSNQEFLHKELKLNSVVRNYLNIIKNPIFICFGFIAIFSYSYIIIYVTVSPFIIQNKFHYSAAANGWFNLLASSAYLIGTYLNSHLIKKIKLKKLMHAGYCIFVTGIFILAITSLFDIYNLFLLLTLNFTSIFAIGFLYPNAAAAASIPFRKTAGTTGSLLSCTQMSCLALATVGSAHISIDSFIPLALLFFILATIIGVLMYYADFNCLEKTSF